MELNNTIRDLFDIALQNMEMDSFDLIDEHKFENDFDVNYISRALWMRIYRVQARIRGWNIDAYNHIKHDEADFYFVKRSGEMGIKLSDEPSDYISPGTKVYREMYIE